jgi:hypothetical protein
VLRTSLDLLPGDTGDNSFRVVHQSCCYASNSTGGGDATDSCSVARPSGYRRLSQTDSADVARHVSHHLRGSGIYCVEVTCRLAVLAQPLAVLQNIVT